MRVAVLYENSVHMQDAIFFLKKNYMQDEIKCFNSTFALATFICDEVKGDVDLLIVCIKSSKDEAIVFAKDMQSFFPHMKLIFFSQTNDCAEEIFGANILLSYHIKRKLLCAVWKKSAYWWKMSENKC